MYVDRVMLPSGDDITLDKPWMSQFAASYHLPGGLLEHQSSPVAAESSATEPGFTSRSGVTPRAWSVPLRHCGVHWVTADARLARALLHHPLLVSVVRQEVVAGGFRTGITKGGQGAGGGDAITAGGGISGGRKGDVVEVPVGSAEIDLSPLLLTRPGNKEPATRWVCCLEVMVVLKLKAWKWNISHALTAQCLTSSDPVLHGSGS